MGKFKDLTGQVFGRITVVSKAANSRTGNIRWNCVCSCSDKTKRIIHGSSLLSGNTKSCGCLSKEITSKRCLKDLTGQTFHRLTVVSRASNSKSGTPRWNCVCSCPNKTETIVAGNALIGGNTKSCGCFQREQSSGKYLKDLTGQIFDRLTVTFRATNDKYGRAQWICICSCPNKTKVIVQSGNLLNKHTTSCGWLAKGYVSKSGTTFLDKIEQLFNIKIEREFELSHRYFDGRYKNYLIEVDSDYWHSAKKAQIIDAQKTQLAKKNGFKLFRVKVNNLKEVEPAIQKYISVLSTLVIE